MEIEGETAESCIMFAGLASSSEDAEAAGPKNVPLPHTPAADCETCARPCAEAASASIIFVARIHRPVGRTYGHRLAQEALQND